MDEKQERIDQIYEAVFSGDLPSALAKCAPDAQYHVVTPLGGEWDRYTGSHPVARYFEEILPAAIATMEDYRVDVVGRDTLDDLVVSRLRSSHGSGVMVFRVTDAGLTDIWAIHGQGREATGPF